MPGSETLTAAKVAPQPVIQSLAGLGSALDSFSTTRFGLSVPSVGFYEEH